MVVLFFGDIFGRSGRRSVASAINSLKDRYQPDIVLGNVENLSGGRGVAASAFKEMRELGVHAFTSGNHIWDNYEVLHLFQQESCLFRPANYPDIPDDSCPGKGFGVVESAGKKLFIVNLMGRVFMDSIDCPFVAVDWILEQNMEQLPVLVDFHAETTSEKYAMGWHLDGRVSAVLGTHTHVQTSDERILPQGTAYITDVGMCGSFDSVIGLKPDAIVRKFMTKRKTAFQVATGNLGINAVVIKIGQENKAVSIERVRESVV